MDYIFRKQIKDDPILRKSFFDLAMKTFHLSFESWYQAGFWTDKYIPYVWIHNNNVIANASVNIIDTVWNGKEKHYIQIGTVMTDTAYQNQGLSRKLLEQIIADWTNKSDCIYLFANNTVIDFYPKFGFTPAVEYQYEMKTPKTHSPIPFIKLNMAVPADRRLLEYCYQQSNPFSMLPIINNYELFMFYCSAFMKEFIYYSPALNIVCIAEQEDNVLLCYDIFGKTDLPMKKIIASITAPNTQKVIFGFTPKEQQNGHFFKIDNVKNDTTLFILKENLFSTHQLMFPVLSHA